MTARACPLCGGEPHLSVHRAALPVFQNVTYATAADARAAPRGVFTLGTCTACGFSYNATFDEALVVYDEHYDNHVPSAAFAAYYRSLATLMAERYDLASGAAYDVGCGKGEFLEILCDTVPAMQGIGIDPSCQPRVSGNLRLEQAKFDGSTFAADTRIVILRHVLEHIAEPLEFLKALCAAMPDAPLFVEVPDLDWILANGAFWDFCYEHCNYFTLPTLRFALESAGFVVEEQRNSFGDQYQWAICRPAASRTAPQPQPADKLAAVNAYAADESARIGSIERMAVDADGVALWGMATKGVILSLLLPDGAVLGGIDGNAAKQGRFAAGSGVAINPPEWLATRGATTVVAMNPNYAAEIREQAEAINPAAEIRTL